MRFVYLEGKQIGECQCMKNAPWFFFVFAARLKRLRDCCKKSCTQKHANNVSWHDIFVPTLFPPYELPISSDLFIWLVKWPSPFHGKWRSFKRTGPLCVLFLWSLLSCDFFSFRRFYCIVTSLRYCIRASMHGLTRGRDSAASDRPHSIRSNKTKCCIVVFVETEGIPSAWPRVNDGPLWSIDGSRFCLF